MHTGITSNNHTSQAKAINNQPKQNQSNTKQCTRHLTKSVFGSTHDSFLIHQPTSNWWPEERIWACNYSVRKILSIVSGQLLRIIPSVSNVQESTNLTTNMYSVESKKHQIYNPPTWQCSAKVCKKQVITFSVRNLQCLSKPLCYLDCSWM